MEPGNQLAGVDWKSIFQSIPAGATAQALRLALTPIVGGSPTLINNGEYFTISFSPEQEERLSAWILTQLNKEPGPVRIETGGIALRVISRQYWPYALGFAALGGLAVYLATKKKGRK